MSQAKIMIVEDDDEIRQLLEIVIGRTEGFNIIATYNNCESAINPLLENKPDVVLMDIELPGMT
ncbi:MAG: response regulator, partial [Paraglaciecola sp.]|nr:response regulator [Paraglaciecola sp.]